MSPITTEDRVLLSSLARQLRTQDNLATSIPIFVVQQQRRTYGIDTAWSDHVCWLHSDELDEVEPGLASSLEAGWHDGAGEPRGFFRTGYRDDWEFVTACFTWRGCEDYILANGHNLRSPRIYVESGYRNREWEELREFFQRQDGVTP